MRFTFDLAKARRNERNKLPGDVLKTYTRQGKSYSYYGPPDDSTPDWRERLLHEEEGIRHLALEHIVVRLSDDSWHFTGPEYTADFFRTHGEVKGRSSANTAALPEALLEQMRADGHAVLTHNHPKSAPPSVEDIGTAMDANLAEIRACTDGGVWVVRRPAAGWPDARSFLTTWLSRFEGPTNRNALARTQFLLSTGVLSDANEEAKAFAENVFSTIYGEECARALGGILSRMGASLEYVPASGRASSSGQPPTGPVSGEQVDDLFRRAAEKAQSLGPAGHEMMLEMVRQLRDLSKARAKRPRGVPYEHNGGWWVIGEDGKRRRAKPPAAQAETQRLTEPTTYRGTLQHLATDPDEHEAETNVHQTTLQQLHHGAKLHGRIAAAASAEADRAVRAKDRAYWSEAHVRHKLAEHHFLVARNMSQANHARTTEHIQGAFEAERHAHELGAAKRLQGRTGVAGHLRRAGVLRDLRNGRHFIFHWSPEMSATPLNKASPGALRIPVMAKAAQTWNVDGLTCRFFQNPGGVNYVTIEVPALATTWTEIVRDDGQAREYARRFAPVLAKGGTPAMGVFQRMQVLDMAKAVRPPQRRASGTAPRFTFDLAKAKGKRYWDGDGEPPAGQGWQRGKRGGWWKPTGAGHTEAPARAARAPGAEPRKRRRATADVGARMADVAEEPAAAPTPAPSIAPGHRWNPHELSDLWHLSRTAVGRTAGTYARKQWVADQYAKQHGLSPTAVYKKMERYGIGEGLTISQEQHVARDRDGNGWQRVSGGGWRHRDDAAAAPMTHEQRRDHLIHAGATALVEAIGKLRAQGWHGKLSDVLPGAKARTIEPLPGEFAIAVTGGPFDYPEPVNGASGWRFVGPRVRTRVEGPKGNRRRIDGREDAWVALEQYAQAVAAQPQGTSWREFARMAHEMEDGDLRKAVGGFRVVLAGGYEQAVGVPLFTFDMAKARRGAHNKLPTDVEKTDSRGRKYWGPPDKPKGRGRKEAASASPAEFTPHPRPGDAPAGHIAISDRDAGHKYVPATARAGIWAAHQSDAGGHVITHLPTGFMLTRAPSGAAAKRLVQHLHQHFPDIGAQAGWQDASAIPKEHLSRLVDAIRDLGEHPPEAPAPRPGTKAAQKHAERAKEHERLQNEVDSLQARKAWHEGERERLKGDADRVRKRGGWPNDEWDAMAAHKLAADHVDDAIAAHREHMARGRKTTDADRKRLAAASKNAEEATHDAIMVGHRTRLARDLKKLADAPPQAASERWWAAATEPYKHLYIERRPQVDDLRTHAASAASQQKAGAQQHMDRLDRSKWRGRKPHAWTNDDHTRKLEGFGYTHQEPPEAPDFKQPLAKAALAVSRSWPETDNSPRLHKGARFVFVLAKAKKRAKASESDLMTAMVGPAHFRDTPKPSPDIDHYGHAHEDRVASMRAQTKAATLKGTDKIRTEALGYALHAKSMAHTHHGHALAWGGDSERHAHGKAAVMQEASHAAWKRVADGDTSPEAIWHASRTAHEAMQHSLIAEEPAPSQVQAAGKRMTERAAALAEQKATAAAGKAPRARKPRAGGAAPAPTPATPQEPAAATAAPKARKPRAPKAAGIPAPPPAPELPMGDAPAKASRKRAPKGVVPAAKGRGWRFVFDLAKAKKQPLGSLSHRKAGTFIKVREEGKPTDWVPAHEVGGRWEAKPEGAKRRGRKKAEAAPAPVPLPPERDETLVWYKDTDGVKAGAVRQLGAKWVVIVSAKPARSRRVSSHDEDMGWGQEGGRLTQQAVRLRDALPHEVAAEEQRRLDKKAAAEAATPGGRFDAWKAAHADAMPHPEHETPPGVKWTEVHRDGTQSFHVGEGPDGSQWAKLTTSSYDDRRTSYLRTPPDPAKAAAVAQQQDHARALLDRIAETGTYTSADLEHLTQDLAQELHNNRLEREAPGRLRLGPNQRPIETADAARAVTLQRVLTNHRVFAGVEGPHDLAFETAYRDPMSMAEYGTVESTLTEVIRKLRGAEPPPGYGPMVQERIALAEGKLATAKAEAEAKERAKAEAAAERAAARATRSSSRSTSRSPSASFTKLRDGSWGVRVEGDADEGDTVTVRRKDGSKESKRLGRLVHDGGSYKLFKMTKAMRFVFDPQALGL